MLAESLVFGALGTTILGYCSGGATPRVVYSVDGSADVKVTSSAMIILIRVPGHREICKSKVGASERVLI